ncbi:unnamed protein product, partial [Mesorhabditis spiculigera]
MFSCRLASSSQAQALRDNYDVSRDQEALEGCGFYPKLNCSNATRLLRDVDTYIFDGDGVLWLGDEPIPGAPEFLHNLFLQGKRVIVLTNNATKSRAAFGDKLRNLQFPEQLTAEALVNPAIVVTDVLVRAGLAHAKNKKVFLIGEKGIRDELKAAGIEYFGSGPEVMADTSDQAYLFQLDLAVQREHVAAVVVGYEKHFNYQKLMKAANYLKRRETLFVATNEDETCPCPDPKLVVPDAGPIVAAVRCASGREPITVGKPNTASFNYICRRWKIDPSRTVMVGDRLNTDIVFGKKHGLKTLLVLSGCHQLEDVRQVVEGQSGSSEVPDLFATSLGACLPRGQPAWHAPPEWNVDQPI